MIWYMIWYDLIYDMIWYDKIWYDIWYDIFVNCSWVDTLWQQYSTHLHTNSTRWNTNNNSYERTVFGAASSQPVAKQKCLGDGLRTYRNVPGYKGRAEGQRRPETLAGRERLTALSPLLAGPTQLGNSQVAACLNLTSLRWQAVNCQVQLGQPWAAAHILGQHKAAAARPLSLVQLLLGRWQLCCTFCAAFLGLIPISDLPAIYGGAYRFCLVSGIVVWRLWGWEWNIRQLLLRELK